jgi:hypothetical protein
MTIGDLLPRLSLRSNLGLKLANAFGVIQTEALPNFAGREFSFTYTVGYANDYEEKDCSPKHHVKTVRRILHGEGFLYHQFERN